MAPSGVAGQVEGRLVSYELSRSTGDWAEPFFSL